MSFLAKWRFFAWATISSPIWLLTPLVILFGIGGHFLFITLLIGLAIATYLGPYKLLRCPHCKRSMLSWFSIQSSQATTDRHDQATVQVYLLLSLFSSPLAASYLGDLLCPHCGHVLHKKSR